METSGERERELHTQLREGSAGRGGLLQFHALHRNARITRAAGEGWISVAAKAAFALLKVPGEQRVQDFVEAVQGDAALLVAAKPVIARFEHESRALVRSTEVNQNGQSIYAAQSRFRLNGQRTVRGQFPTRVRVASFLIALKDMRLNLRPQAPHKDAAGIVQRNWQAAADEETFLPDDAGVGGEFARVLLPPRFQREVGTRFRKPDVHRQPVVGLTAALANMSHEVCFRQKTGISELKPLGWL
jgi:hypothetical protein